ncbi:AMP-binding protein [Clavibacter sp. VKM Ac-2873]|uniref:(2,3-dihydroxybenzoyl)adenylate synthase n=1 Tax=Clavibacter sp. VKM Ac-2873 TaxID=2783813 RepID=UPI00188BDCA1|nr:AMP-binding protein [Clavibacter sp. VKM Ac-2873]MBF4618536.1 AMP-binding protein [Clavibacter sp. VKM Ac-2873]
MHEREGGDRPDPGAGSGSADWVEAMVRAARAAGREPDARLDGILRRSAARVPDRTALVGAGGRWTHAELDAEVDLAARGLRRAGVRPGDRILLQLADGAAFVIAWCALVRAGAVPVHAMPAHRLMELAHLAAGSGARGLVVAERVGREDGRELAAGVRAACPGLDLVIVHGAGRGDGALTWDEVRDGGRAEDPAAGPDPGLDPVAPDGAPRLALLLHSGGTTGLPKLIPRHHAEYSYNAWAAARAAGVGPDAVLLAVLPVAFNFTLACPGVLGVLDAGGTVVIAPDPDPATAFALVARERVTHVALTPTLARAWIDEAAHTTADLSSLRVVQVGGARLDDVTARALEPALGATLQQVYGMAEGLVCTTALDDPPELRWSTQGRPTSPDDRIRLRAADGSLAADGAEGELETRGPCTLRAYHAAPDADATAFTTDGFYRTGDLVRRLPSGHIVVTGRAKDQVNRGGEKYAAAEVERYLLAMPSVRAAAVVPVPDPDLGERAVAVVACAGPAPDRRQVVAHLRALGVAAYKHPDRVVALPELPLTAVGKIDKARVAALLAAEAESDAGAPAGRDAGGGAGA